jgi:hypothetical protein
MAALLFWKAPASGQNSGVTVQSTQFQDSALLGNVLSGSWTLNGWTQTGSGAAATFTCGTSTVPCTGTLQNSPSLTAGQTYQVSIGLSLTSTTNGDVTVSIGGVADTQYLNSNWQDYYGNVYTFTPTVTTSGPLIITPVGNFDGTIGPISVTQIAGTIPSAPWTMLDHTGAQALTVLPTLASLNNLFLGMGSGISNVSGRWNVGIGYDALAANTSGFMNIVIGSYAGSSNQTGADNTVIGPWALQYNTTGSSNIAIGGDALRDNTTGQNNVAIGAAALQGPGGFPPPASTGQGNTAVGSDCGISITLAGSENSCFGATAMGSQAAGTTGVGNDAFGFGALFSLTSGSHNDAIGLDAMHNATTAIANVAIGYQAQENITAGYYNVSVGPNTLLALSTGSNNSALGLGADVNSASASYRTVIGAGANGTTDNTVTLGRSVDTVVIPGSISMSSALPAAQGGTGNGGLTFPAGATTVPQTVASGSLSLATSPINSGACQAVTAGSVNSVTAANVATTDVIEFTPNESIKAVIGYTPGPSGGLAIEAYPTSGYVNFDVCNWNASAITPGAVTLNWRVTR